MKSAEVTLRAAERRDLPAIGRSLVALAHHGARADTRRALTPEAPRRLLEEARDRWFGHFLPFAAVWVAEHAERGIVGCVAGTPVAVHPAYQVARTVRLEHLWVDPEHRRQGIARRLVDRLREVATGAGYARLEVTTLSADPAAIGFWEAMGFGRWMTTLVAD